MPQLIGVPIKNGRADQMVQSGELQLSSTGEVDLTEQFKQFLKENGGTISSETVDASLLKATQDELQGEKVASMWFALKQNPAHPGIRAPIFVSSDHYILDGHHRWAAIFATEFGLEERKTVLMPVFQINFPIKQLLEHTSRFLEEYGIEPKAG